MTTWWMQTLANESRHQKVPLETGSHDYVVDAVTSEPARPEKVPLETGSHDYVAVPVCRELASERRIPC